MQFSFISAALLFAVSAISAPTAVPAELQERQSATRCGSYSYSQSRVQAAFNKGVSYYNNGQQVGSGNYPHTYNNYEGKFLNIPPK